MENQVQDPMQNYLNMHKSLYDLCMFFKEKKFNQDLPPFVLTLNPDTRNTAYGWCWDGIWSVEETGQRFCEINICSQYLTRPFEEVAATVLHELVHLYANFKKIKDTSRNGKHHNRAYKELAERFGLTVEHSGGYHGWSKTRLNEETKALLSQFDHSSIRPICDTRNERKKAKPKTPPKPSKTYKCPCGQSFRSTKVLDIVCGKCNRKFEIEEPKDG